VEPRREGETARGDVEEEEEEERLYLHWSPSDAKKWKMSSPCVHALRGTAWLALPGASYVYTMKTPT